MPAKEPAKTIAAQVAIVPDIPMTCLIFMFNLPLVEFNPDNPANNPFSSRRRSAQ
jgi:hypothetical protein